MLDVVRFWLDLGLDGFRLDAVPYLFERDGTDGENLPETHDYLRRVRSVVDKEFPGRVLLAEANQWPTDVVDYFGDSDECHMCFHFPLMPRMFMAVRREQRQPITEILEQTPAIPDGCQWGLFLRNHDELTLEMVTDEERDYMYSEYAKDPRMRRNVGIARRLFPLIDNDRRVAELFHTLLFSMPGSPVMYYGDEIGMGDNIFLGDRDGVRTPMQWTPDRNGGFSTADFAQLYSPPLMDPVYGFSRVNVESQQRDPSSFLHWVRRMLQVRSEHPVFGLGSFEVLEAVEPVGPRLHPGVPAARHRGRRPGAVRQQPGQVAAAGRAVPVPLQRLHPGRADRRRALPPHRRAALLRHPRAVRAPTGSPWSAPTAEPGPAPVPCSVVAQPFPTPPPAPVRTCYRHPGQPAGVVCQRCDRPICPALHAPGLGRVPLPGVREEGRPEGVPGPGGPRREPADPHPDPDRRERRRVRARHRHDRRPTRSTAPASWSLTAACWPRAPSTGARSTASPRASGTGSSPPGSCTTASSTSRSTCTRSGSSAA